MAKYVRADPHDVRDAEQWRATDRASLERVNAMLIRDSGSGATKAEDGHGDPVLLIRCADSKSREAGRPEYVVACDGDYIVRERPDKGAPLIRLVPARDFEASNVRAWDHVPDPPVCCG